MAWEKAEGAAPRQKPLLEKEGPSLHLALSTERSRSPSHLLGNGRLGNKVPQEMGSCQESGAGKPKEGDCSWLAAVLQ